MKKFLLIVFVLIVLLVAGFVGFVMSIDWNEHKAKIAAQFSSLTGKRVVFEGAVELSFFPSPYLTVENVKIYNDKQQDNNPLAQINRLVANLELLPFIKGEFNVKKMSLVHPMVNVQRQENGSWNWDTELTPEQRTKMAETPVKLDSLSIESALRVYAGDKYPYMTYEYYETNVTNEDGGTDGELLCEIWTRNSFAELIDIKEKLKDYFKQKNIMVDNNVCHFDYVSSTPEDTGDAELKKLQVNIMTKYWKGA